MKKWTPPTDLNGLNFRFNSKGYCIIELDYWADKPKASPEWTERERKKYHEKQWRREMLRDWTISSGDAFYPEFQVAPERYQASIGWILEGQPVVRGFDLGFRAPACYFMQASKAGRVAVFREIVPKDIDAHNFRDLVRYCSGEIELEQLVRDGRVRALHWAERIGRAKDVPEPPWFPPGTTFLNYAGPECYAVRSIEGEERERNDYEVFASVGIPFQVLATRVKAREEVIRRLLGVLPDGKPGLVIDPDGCPELVKMFNGGLAYQKATKMNPLPVEPAKDGHFDNIHDALGYGLINIAPVAVDTRGHQEMPLAAPSGRIVGTQRASDIQDLNMTVDW